MIGIIILGFVTIGNSIPAFNTGNLMKLALPSPFKEILVGEKINSFLKLNSADYKEFRCNSKKMNLLYLPKYEKYQFNPLFQYPIIKSDRGVSSFNFIVPNTSLLLRKMAEGIYWNLRNYFKDKDSNDFLSRFGNAFEKYCGELLKNHFGEENVKRVDEVIGSDYHEKKHGDNNIYIFECKSGLLSSIARQTFLRETLRTWLSNNLITHVTQLT